MCTTVNSPDPDRPVSQIADGQWLFSIARAALSTLTPCQWTLCEPRNAKCNSSIFAAK